MQSLVKLAKVSLSTVVAGSMLMSFGQTNGWAGRWQGDLDGSPAVILNISEAEGGIQGTAQFNILERGEDGRPRLAGTMEAALVNTREQGNDVTFQVVREERNGESSDQTLVSFTLHRTGDSSAKLIRQGGGDGSHVEMLKK